MSLAEILQKYFKCKNPFLKKRRVVGHWSDGESDYEYLTHSGGKAYGQLVGLLYDLKKLIGSDFDANEYVEYLDSIVTDGEQY